MISPDSLSEYGEWLVRISGHQPYLADNIFSAIIARLEDYALLFAIAALAGIALFTRRLDRSPVTIPMLCVLMGGVLYLTNGIPLHLMSEELAILAKVALAVVLFTDAAHLKIARLNERKSWPARLLIIGSFLSVGFGTLFFIPLFPGLPFWQVALIAALLTPTDAALGQSLAPPTGKSPSTSAIP